MPITNIQTPSDDDSSDSEDRIQDFLARHGGASSRPSREEAVDADAQGWSEVYAADGYTLRCDWSRIGSKEELSFSEIPPSGANHRR
jgi:hypothetical protein